MSARWGALASLLALGGCAEAPCNGSLAACDLPLPEVMFPGSHNAMSTAADGWLVPNHGVTLVEQLALGLRALLVDTYAYEGGAWACHGLCELGKTPLVEVWSDVRGALEDHPRDVVVLIVQANLDPATHEATLREAGLWPYVYVHPEGAPWPTVGALVARGQRVVFTVETGDELPAWSPSFYDVGFDTPYDVSRPEDFSCDLLRGDPSHPWFLINHWISAPFPVPDSAAEVNGAASLRAHVEACREVYGRTPSVLAVNFAETGDLVEVAREYTEAAVE